MTSPNTKNSALATTDAVIEVVDALMDIAEALHSALRLLPEQGNVSTEKAYALITEEYGLRTRLGILRSDATNRTVDGITVSQEQLLDLLRAVATSFRQTKSLESIAFVVNSVSVLCVSIFPGKTETVNFLIERLQGDLVTI
jgi:hypothetical protein